MTIKVMVTTIMVVMEVKKTLRMPAMNLKLMKKISSSLKQKWLNRKVQTKSKSKKTHRNLFIKN